MNIRENEESVDSEDKAIYFLHKSGRKRQVSREEWERSWLEWWNRTNKRQNND